jgi:hypothetical protein
VLVFLGCRSAGLPVCRIAWEPFFYNDRHPYLDIVSLSMRLLLLITTFLAFWCSVLAQPKTDVLLQKMLSESQSELVKMVMKQPDTFRLQIIYTQINRDKNNLPTFENYYFNFNNDLYFNPASTVKLPLALLSLEKLNRIGRSDVTKFTAIQFDSSYAGQFAAFYDSTSESNLPSLSHYIKKAFLVSDNDAYNRMYQFVGQNEINGWLREKGFKNTQITRQFMSYSEEQNRHTNQVRFLDPNGKVIFTQPAAYSPWVFNFDRILKVGKAHRDRNDSLVQAPIDFTKANIVGLEDLQRLLKSILFPESMPAQQRFNLTKDDEAFLFRYLSQYPSETNYPKYDTSQYYDSYVKFYFKHGSHQMPPDVRVFNKVGWAYGFLTDAAYVVDFKNKVEFMLTATVYANSDGILNDDRYDYDEIGWPFLYDLGQIVYQYELKRSRKFRPDLKRFNLRYEKRDPADTRVPLRDVGN